MEQTAKTKVYSLHFKWTISKGRETYGYNICSLLVNGTKVAQCMGGGYDMQGTVFANWLEKEFAPELMRLFAPDFAELKAGKAETRQYTLQSGDVVFCTTPKNYYGATIRTNSRTGQDDLCLDGAAGLNAIERIANAIGLTMAYSPESNRSRNHSYYTVTATK